jgi:Flp pilus assembly pilin Flp
MAPVDDRGHFHCMPRDAGQLRSDGVSVMKALVSRFLAAESGAAAPKYGLIAGVLSAAIVTAVLGIASKLAVGADGMGR